MKEIEGFGGLDVEGRMLFKGDGQKELTILVTIHTVCDMGQ
jgi:hypothetical protein